VLWPKLLRTAGIQREKRLFKKGVSIMRLLRTIIAPAAALVFATLPALGVAQAETKIAIGKVTGGSGFHIPSYVAMNQGYFKDEGLDARFVALSGKAQVTAGLAGSLDFVPIPSGGAQAALSGADIRYIVGESLKSQWVLLTRPDIKKPEDLKGKTLGYGRPGGAEYDEASTVLELFFKMRVGDDYKVISFQDEAARIAALINGDIQGAAISAPRVPQALKAGLKVLLRTGDYIPRAGGAIWARKAYIDAHPDTVKKFIRAIARGVTTFRNDKKASVAALKAELGIKTDEEAGVIWDQLHNTFGAELPPKLFRQIFEGRRKTMIAAKQWPKDKPLPDPEQWLERKMLEATLKEMKYVPTKLDAPSKIN
jgi:NitT/TauT family transport system substrate-binding protein